eukprot:gene31278-35695_t
MAKARVGNEMASERGCGTCTMCCKVMGVMALEKPEGAWCAHCKIGQGCGIYETRPDECRSFGCLYLLDPAFPDKYRPDRTRIVFFLADGGDRVGAMVDPGQPNAWRSAENYDLLKRMAKAAVPLGKLVVVYVKGEMTVVMPDRDVPMGRFSPDKKLAYEAVGTGPLARLEPILVDA